MATPTLILLGDFSDDRSLIEAAVSELGWQVTQVTDCEQLAQIRQSTPVAGTLVDMATCHSADCLSAVCDGQALRPVLCTSARDRLRVDELETLRAFDTLLLPLHPDELRQSLRFLAAALRQKPALRHRVA